MNELPGIGSLFIRKGFWDRQSSGVGSFASLLTVGIGAF